MFQGPAKGQIMAIGRDKAYFTDKDTRYRTLDLDDTVTLIGVIIKNAFVIFGGKIFRQTTGVPMGSNCSPMMADLALTIMEHRFVIKADFDTQRKLRHVVRYIDDILAVNCPEFSDFAKKIYPTDLILKRADDPSKPKVPFLDLHISRTNSSDIDLYDKTKDFNFSVVKFSHYSANVPRQTIYQIFYSQLIRITRIITTSETWHDRTKELIGTCLAVGADKLLIQGKLFHFMRSYDTLLWRYGIHSQEASC